MSLDWAKHINWTTVGTWTQIATVGFLAYQLKLTRAQVKASQDALGLAYQQMGEAEKRSQQERADAVIPRLVVTPADDGIITESEFNSKRINFDVVNAGRGAAFYVTLRLAQRQCPLTSTNWIPVVNLSEPQTVDVLLPVPFEQLNACLHVAWADMYGNTYSMRYDALAQDGDLVFGPTNDELSVSRCVD